MAVYTVHEPPLRRYETTTDPDRFVFVRDGFSFWAFLFGPLWMLYHRMWLALVCYLVVMGALQIGLHQLEMPAEIASLVGFLIALLIGFEAGTLRRFTLARRRWSNVGVIVGDDREMAEQRFFDSWVRGGANGPWLPPPSPPARADSASGVIGLFPQPGVPR